MPANRLFMPPYILASANHKDFLMELAFQVIYISLVATLLTKPAKHTGPGIPRWHRWLQNWLWLLIISGQAIQLYRNQWRKSIFVECLRQNSRFNSSFCSFLCPCFQWILKHNKTIIDLFFASVTENYKGPSVGWCNCDDNTNTLACITD